MKLRSSTLVLALVGGMTAASPTDAAATAAGEVLVVDAGGGPGAAFTDLQPAVDAANDGDLILVRSGKYSAFRIDDKALFVQAQAGAVVLVESDFVVPADVRNLSAGRHVVLRGLELRGGTFASVFPMASTVVFGLAAADNAGSLWVEDCRVSGTGGGARVERSSAAVFLRCELRAEDLGGSLELYGFPGGSGLVGDDASIHLYGTSLRGGAGSAFEGLSAFDGGHGASLEGGLLFASGCSFAGGTGGISVVECAAGGHGLLLAGGAPEAWTLGSTLLGGPALAGPFCATAAGAPVSVQSGTHDTFAVPPLELVARSPVTAGEPVELSVSGPPGAVVLLLFGREPLASFRPAASGSILVAPPRALLPLGRLPASGELEARVRLGALVGTEGLRLQSAYVTARGFVLGSASAIVALPRGEARLTSPKAAP